MSQKTIPYDLTSVSSTPRFPAGTVVTRSNGETFVYVRVSGSGAAAGSPAYIASTMITASNWVVTPTASAGKLPVGFFVSAPGNGQYCWIKVRGQVTLTNSGESGAVAGTVMYVRNNGGTITYTTGVNPPAGGANAMVVGVLLDSVTPGGNAPVWINLPFLVQER